MNRCYKREMVMMIDSIKRLITLKEVIGSLMIFIAVLIVASILWGNRTFSVKTLNQMIFHLKVPMDGTDDGIYVDWFIHSVPQSFVIVTVLELIVFNLPIEKLHLFITEHMIIIGVLAIGIALIFALYNYQIIGYAFDMLQTTDLYEKHYVDPQSVNITFPKQKRNIIHIYLESVENAYLATKSGGGQEKSYMPELEELAVTNINFSHHDKIGGSLTLEGTQWTIASMVGQVAGIPLLLPFNSKSYDANSSFFKGIFTLGELLEKNGYVDEIMMGSDSNFGCTSNLYKQHGNYIVSDYNTAIKEGRIDKDYFVFWGYEDKKLFEFAKADISKLAQGNKPFNMEIVTIDTHTPDGYRCADCKDEYEQQYANVIACQSRQVNNFINWCKQQSWYENTTIVITGDHNSMSEKFFTNLDRNYVRTPYNCFINSAITGNNKNRKFSIIDMYPTILAAMGVDIEGDKLGLGVNLFSGKKTLVEQYGFKKLNQEVKRKSAFYRRELIDEDKANYKQRNLYRSKRSS